MRAILEKLECCAMFKGIYEEGSSSKHDEVNELQRSTPSLLSKANSINYDEQFVIKRTKKGDNATKEVKSSCKVLHFSSEWSFEEVLEEIEALVPIDYPQLFIFIIAAPNFGFSAESQEQSSAKAAQVQAKLVNFSNSRPMILQMSSDDEGVTRFYKKEESSLEFEAFDPMQHNIEDIDLPPNSSLHLRFLKALKLTDEVSKKLILKYARSSTLAEFKAVLDVPFEYDGMTLELKAKGYLSQVILDSSSTSVLLTAVENQNADVIDFLVNDCTHLIQQLPFDHQVRVSTAAFETKQLDVLCCLLDIVDFPFPDCFKKSQEPIDHDRLKAIVDEREDLEKAIKAGNVEYIKKFIDEYSNLKVVYSTANNSALGLAAESEKFLVFNFLKLRGFHPNEKLEEFDKKCKRFVAEQRKENVKECLRDDQRSVNVLCNKSLIYNKKITKDQEKDYRRKIRSWFEDINKINDGKDFLDVPASCERLKIIFDFESTKVENASLGGLDADGVMYSNYKWIFIGAKLLDCKNVNREQKIKGVLAHELCHYVMKMVYENQEHPYYIHSKDMKEKYAKIVNEIDKLSKEDSADPDDECDGIISSVFKLYDAKDHHAELIVRIVQIMTQFDGNEQKLQHIQERYKILFDFWSEQVVPDLRKYLRRNVEAIRLNRTIGLLTSVRELKFEFHNLDKVTNLAESKILVVKTNVPKLLFLNILKHRQEKDENLFESQNMFIDPEELLNYQLWDDFKAICFEVQELRIFVDCTRSIPDGLGNILRNKKLNFIFVVSSEDQDKKVNSILEKKEQNAAQMKINYNWNDLTEKSQDLALETRVNFQNNSQIKLSELLIKPVEAEEATTSTEGRSDVSGLVDDQLLKLILENQQVSINRNEEDEKAEKYFNLLYIERSFNRKTATVKKFMSNEELFSEVNKKRCVLISDQAGNGKSWTMKNFTKTLQERNPTSWVTYVDLKQFIDKFEADKPKLEFSTFMVEHILKLQQPFENKIFQQLYKDGRVFILLDGFDEIAPNCAEFVSKLAQNFQQNGGNQLWIATRDYFEVDLMKKLELDVAYGLYKMSMDEGVDMIAKSWMLMDLQKDKNEPKSKEEFDESIEKEEPKYESYQEKAQKIIRKALMFRNNPVGLPQLFKMIAAGFKDEENVDDLQGIKIYVKFIDILYTRWADEKGKIRKQANIDCQKNESDFFKFHRYHAIMSLFPELAKILFPNYDGSEWKQEEIIACGILTIINGKVYFIHETFREYFVAGCIAKALKNPKVDKKVVEVLVEVLTVKKFEIIRVFLNDMITDASILTKIKAQIQKHKKKFYEMTFFADFFINNLTNLVDLVLEIFKTGSYEQVKEVLGKSAVAIAKYTKDAKGFLKFQDFIFEFLNIADLKELIMKGELFHQIIRSSLEIEVFKGFVTKTEEKAGREFVRQELMSLSTEGNIFYFMTKSTNLDAQKIQQFLTMMENFLTVSEMFELMNNCDVYKRSIMQVCVGAKDEEKLRAFWTEIENYFTAQNHPEGFKELVKQQDQENKNILHASAWSSKIDFHETIWELLLTKFEDQEELKEFMFQKDKYGINFVHQIVRGNKNPAIIEWTFKFLKENFSDAQYQEILSSKGEDHMNLLQTAAYFSKCVEVHQFLWKLFRDICGTDDKFLEMLKENDRRGRNILQLAVGSSCSSEVFEFLIKELEKLASRDEIRDMLRRVNVRNQNVLQLAACSNSLIKSKEHHATLWKTLRKYFEKSEILELIKNVDKDGNNALHIAVSKEFQEREILELTWNEIKSFLTHDEQVEYLQIKGKLGKNLKEMALEDKINRIQSTAWINSLMEDYNNEIFKECTPKECTPKERALM